MSYIFGKKALFDALKSNKDNQSSKKYLINRPFPKHRPHQLNIWKNMCI